MQTEWVPFTEATMFSTANHCTSLELGNMKESIYSATPPLDGNRYLTFHTLFL